MTRAVAAVLVLSSCSTAASRRPATHELRIDEPTAATATTTTTTTTSTTTATTVVPTTTAVVARKARASRSAERSRPPPAVTPSRPDVAPDVDGLDWAALRRCESGGDYAENTGNGFYGAYQFALRTWRATLRNLVRMYPGADGEPSRFEMWVRALPSSAPPQVQDVAARLQYAVNGRRPWPYCGRFL